MERESERESEISRGKKEGREGGEIEDKRRVGEGETGDKG